MNLSHSSSRSGVGALDTRIQKTLSNTFIALTGMWVITAAAGYLSLDLKMGLGMLLGLFVGSLVVMFATLAFRNSPFGLVLLALFSALEGMSIGPLLNHYLNMQNGSQMVLTAAGLTAAATFACAMYCITTRKSFSRLGGFLFAGLIVLLLASIAGIFFHSTVFNLVVSGLACMLFIGYMLYDLSAVVNGEEDNYISAALGVYLDMFNFFFHLLRILGILGSSDD